MIAEIVSLIGICRSLKQPVQQVPKAKAPKTSAGYNKRYTPAK